MCRVILWHCFTVQFRRLESWHFCSTSLLGNLHSSHVGRWSFDLVYFSPPLLFRGENCPFSRDRAPSRVLVSVLLVPAAITPPPFRGALIAAPRAFPPSNMLPPICRLLLLQTQRTRIAHRHPCHQLVVKSTAHIVFLPRWKWREFFGRPARWKKFWAWLTRDIRCQLDAACSSARRAITVAHSRQWKWEVFTWSDFSFGAWSASRFCLGRVKTIPVVRVAWWFIDARFKHR